MNGVVRLLWLMAAPIHVGWQFLLKRVLIVQSHSKILDPLGRYVILQAEIINKMYVLISVCADGQTTMKMANAENFRSFTSKNF